MFPLRVANAIFACILHFPNVFGRVACNRGKGGKGGSRGEQFESRAGSSGRVVCACGSCDGRNWPPCPHSGFLVAFFVITYIVWAFTVWHVAAFEILFTIKVPCPAYVRLIMGRCKGQLHVPPPLAHANVLVYELIFILVRRVLITLELVHTALLRTRTVQDSSPAPPSMGRGQGRRLRVRRRWTGAGSTGAETGAQRAHRHRRSRQRCRHGSHAHTHTRTRLADVALGGGGGMRWLQQR